jgi:hypothetical protein
MPQTVQLSLAEIIRDTLLNRLFKIQIKFWKKKLDPIINTNAANQGVGLGNMLGIHYLGKNWRGSRFPAVTDCTYLPLASDSSEFEKELLMIVNELAQLEAEEYEASRFLSGLVLFPAPVEVFQKVLGRQLFSECEQEIQNNLLSAPNYTWDANAQNAIMTYVNHHDYILTTMNQRLLVNLITQDQTRQ